jgi:hypothetical protein
MIREIKLLATSYKLQIMNYEIRDSSYKLRDATYKIVPVQADASTAQACTVVCLCGADLHRALRELSADS